MTNPRITRRIFMQKGASAGLGLMLFPGTTLLHSRRVWADEPDPHFFLQIVFPTSSGADCSYLFDARSLEMTQKGKIQNYLGTAPKEWVGTNGVKSLAHSIVDPLRPFMDRFSVLNGVHMATAFNNHPQNLNFLMTGSPFGGQSFVPHLNQLTSLSSRPLDGLQKGPLTAVTNNTGNIVPLSVAGARNLVSRLGKVPPMDPTSSLFGFMRSRINLSSVGGGNFAAGARNMGIALDSSPALAKLLAQITLPDEVPDTEQGFLHLMAQAFKMGATRSAILSIALPNGATFDTHDPSSAAQQPKTFTYWISELAKVFTFLRDTEFAQGRSLFDVTTVMIASEFGRTMRQPGRLMHETGTDHNPLSNTVILGGKGIKGGMVIGESDFSEPGEILSKAHLGVDAASLCTMGRPFDFDRLIAIKAKPEEFKIGDYLNISSVINTIYAAFGVPSIHYRKLGRLLGEAPALTRLLS